MAQSGSNKKVANSLVTASCAAVIAVYVAGYERTEAAAEKFASQVAERRVAPRIEPTVTKGEPGRAAFRVPRGMPLPPPLPALRDTRGRTDPMSAANGKPLWSFQTSQLWKASPMTYMFDNKQYIAVAAGSTIIAFGLP